DRASWEQLVRLAADRAELLAWAKAALPSAAVPCVCTDGSCLRCRTEHIIAVNGARQDEQADTEAEPGRPPAPRLFVPSADHDGDFTEAEPCRWIRWDPPNWSILETRPRPGVIARYWAKTIFGAAGLSAVELTPIWEPAFRRVVLLLSPQGPLSLETA